MQQVVLVTGASSGIGEAIANYLMDRNYTVYGTSRSSKPKEAYPFAMLVLDVTKQDTITSAINEIIAKEGRLDVLVNNAGMGITGPIEETPTNEMRAVFETNFFGAIEVMKASLVPMRKQKSGKIINITSIAGYMGLPYRGVYSATKGALELVTEALSMEVAEFNIQATNIAPGDFATNIASGRYHAPVLEDSPYRKNYKANLDLMDAHVDEGGDPIAMAKAVHKVIQTKKTKLHYKVGSFLQKFSIVLKRILPDRVYEGMLMKHYHLK